MATQRVIFGNELEEMEAFAPVKAVLIGPAESGKSALFKRIIGEDFEERYIATIGVDYGSKDKASESDPSFKIKLKLWDTAGQDGYRHIRRTYYKGAQLAIFTLDGSRDLSLQQEQLLTENEELQAKNKTVLRILVVTKKDLEQKITAEELAAFKEKMDISEHLSFSAKEQDSKDLDTFLFEQIKIDIQKRNTAQQALGQGVLHPQLGRRRNLEDKFNQSIGMVEQGEVLREAATKEAGQRFLKELTALKNATLNDLDANKLSIEEAEQLAESSRILSTKVESLAVNSNDIKKFRTDTAALKKTSLLGKIIGAVLGAAIGVVVGAMVGMAAGPAAALTALYCGVQGAIIGASVGGAVFGAAGAWCAMWLMKKNHPATRLEAAAKAVEEANRLQV